MSRPSDEFREIEASALPPMHAEVNSEKTIPATGRLLGVDFGTIRVGTAISDPGQSLASPLEVYTRRNTRLDEKYFTDLVSLEQVVGLVVGLPVHMSGQASEKSRQAVKFGTWLAEITALPVTWFDERYTTAMAREILNQTNLSGPKRKAQLDKLAAQILLSAYLESRQSSLKNQ